MIYVLFDERTVYLTKTDEISFEIDFSRSNAYFVHWSNCSCDIETPPGLLTRQSSPSHVAIVMIAEDNSSSSLSGSVKMILLQNEFSQIQSKRIH